jgi:cytosine/adenosine deaminase-related metal-dependent hydrolase
LLREDAAVTVTVFRAGWVLPIAAAPIKEGEIAVRDGRIIAVGRDLEADRYEEHDGILLPGLVNAHTHLQYGPSFADLATADLAFTEWLPEITRRRHLLDDAAWLEETKASAAQALQTGTTAVADVVTNPAAASGRRPLQGVSYLESVGADDAVWAAREEVRILAALENYLGADVGLSPHTPYTLGTNVFRALVELARSMQRRLHPHLAESAAESEFVLAGTGPFRAVLEARGLRMELAEKASGLTPTQYLDSLGALGPDVHVAHGVHVSASDRRLLRTRDTAVALCARSNAILQSGEAPVAAYRAEGNHVAVGTDGLSSTPDLDLLAELRALHALARKQGSDERGLNGWLVRAATHGGAQAIGREDLGVLVPGARADLAVVQGETSTDPYETVVRGRSTTTYLAGEMA